MKNKQINQGPAEFYGYNEKKKMSIFLVIVVMICQKKSAALVCPATRRRLVIEPEIALLIVFVLRSQCH